MRSKNVLNSCHMRSDQIMFVDLLRADPLVRFVLRTNNHFWLNFIKIGFMNSMTRGIELKRRSVDPLWPNHPSGHPLFKLINVKTGVLRLHHGIIKNSLSLMVYINHMGWIGKNKNKFRETYVSK